MELIRRDRRTRSFARLQSPSEAAFDIPMNTAPVSFRQWVNHGAPPPLSAAIQRKDVFTMQTYEHFQHVCKSTWTTNMENGINVIVFLGDCLIDISDPKTADIRVILTRNHERNVELRGAFANYMSLPQAVNKCRTKCETAFGVLEKSMRIISSTANDLHMSLGPLGKLAQSTQKHSSDASINKQWHAREVYKLIDVQLEEQRSILAQWIDLGEHISNLHEVLTDQLGVFNNEERRLEREIRAGRNKTESLEERIQSLTREQSVIANDLSSQRTLRREILGQRTHLRNVQGDTTEELDKERANLRRAELTEADEQSRFNMADKEDRDRRDSASMFSKLFGSSYAQATNEHKQRSLQRGVHHQKNLDHQLVVKSKIRSLEQELEAVQRKIWRTDDPSTKEREVELRKRIDELAQEVKGAEDKIEKEREKFDEAEKILLNNEQMLEYVELVEDATMARLTFGIVHHMASRWEETCTQIYQKALINVAPMGSISSAAAAPGVFVDYQSRSSDSLSQVSTRSSNGMAGLLANAYDTVHIDGLSRDERRQFLWEGQSRTIAAMKNASDTVWHFLFLFCFLQLLLDELTATQERTRLIECLNKSYQDVMVSPEVVNVAKQRSISWVQQLTRLSSRRRQATELPAHEDLL
ncbi:hypothetical protein FHL15_003316 [Xylaria flabelliformis]|uniref:Uncharacterized protein n=1 Tax=Xylaria flabelliformis TaxID=2512241 RepID=A0A553I6D2_9PEZI|nr:hypothetical protein FHL15_003316 [Xylaria flabelliformis]